VLKARVQAYLQVRSCSPRTVRWRRRGASRAGRIVTTHAWSALFAETCSLARRRMSWKLLSRTTSSHAPCSRPDPAIDGTRSTTTIALSFEQKLIVVAGTEYAGESKDDLHRDELDHAAKGILPMHCSAISAMTRMVAPFFGLSAPERRLCRPTRTRADRDGRTWLGEKPARSNFEGVCYAK